MLDKLYQNVGKLLQGLAKGAFVLETIGSIIAGLVMIFNGEDEAIALGWCLLLFGWIVAFLSSLTLYGFGVLVENAEINIKKNETSENPRPPKNEPSPKSEPACQPTPVPTQEEPLSANKPQSPTQEPQKKVIFEEMSLTEQLAYALRYQTNDGLLRCLRKIDDDRVRFICAQPIPQIRTRTEELLNSLRSDIGEIEVTCNQCGSDFYVKIQKEGVKEIICPDCDNRVMRRISICPNCEKINISAYAASTVKCDDCHTKYNLN